VKGVGPGVKFQIVFLQKAIRTVKNMDTFFQIEKNIIVFYFILEQNIHWEDKNYQIDYSLQSAPRKLGIR
jgi:hypothetical protein